MEPDEFEFAYQVWRRNPDRIVGFPPRSHFINEHGELEYDAGRFTKRFIFGHFHIFRGNNYKIFETNEDTINEISIILTGVSFYHNYYNYLYTFKTPQGAVKWVDDQMNCEDILMNFIIANQTNKTPIKVTPRKFFKSPTQVTVFKFFQILDSMYQPWESNKSQFQRKRVI